MEIVKNVLSPFIAIFVTLGALGSGFLLLAQIIVSIVLVLKVFVAIFASGSWTQVFTVAIGLIVISTIRKAVLAATMRGM